MAAGTRVRPFMPTASIESGANTRSFGPDFFNSYKTWSVLAQSTFAVVGFGRRWNASVGLVVAGVTPSSLRGR